MGHEAPRLSIRAMAARLGVSKSQIARDEAEGMPMADVEAARAWRAAHRDIARTTGARMARPGPPAPPAAPRSGPVRNDQPSPFALLAEVERLGWLALSDPAAHLAALRQALREVPGSHRDMVQLDEAVWGLLLSPLFAALPELVGDGSDEEADPADDAFAWLYRVACGEAQHGE